MNESTKFIVIKKSTIYESNNDQEDYESDDEDIDTDTEYEEQEELAQGISDKQSDQELDKNKIIWQSEIIKS